MNRLAGVFLLTICAAWLPACGSADEDPTLYEELVDDDLTEKPDAPPPAPEARKR